MDESPWHKLAKSLRSQFRSRRRPGSQISHSLKILGLRKLPDAEELRKCYLEQVKKVHPDRPGGDLESFKTLAEAYSILEEFFARLDSGKSKIRTR